MSGRKKRFYYADGTFDTVTAEVWERKARAQAAAAARHGKEVWRNSKGRVSILDPAQAAQRRARSERVAAAPRLQGGRLGAWQRPAEVIPEPPPPAAPEPPPPPAQAVTVRRRVELRGDFQALVADAIDAALAAGIDLPRGLVDWTFAAQMGGEDFYQDGGPIPFRRRKGEGASWWASTVFAALVAFAERRRWKNRRPPTGADGDEPGDRGYQGGWRPAGGATEVVSFGFTTPVGPEEYVDLVPTMVTLRLYKKPR